ncbi:hypothetical protein ES703_57683 [subsurface metagenome]
MEAVQIQACPASRISSFTYVVDIAIDHITKVHAPVPTGADVDKRVVIVIIGNINTGDRAAHNELPAFTH